jgi:hypothetical protein
MATSIVPAFANVDGEWVRIGSAEIVNDGHVGIHIDETVPVEILRSALGSLMGSHLEHFSIGNDITVGEG